MFRFVIFVSNYPGEPRVAAVTWLCTHLSLLVFTWYNALLLRCFSPSTSALRGKKQQNRPLLYGTYGPVAHLVFENRNSIMLLQMRRLDACIVDRSGGDRISKTLDIDNF